MVNVYEAKAQLSKLIDKAASGEEVILAKAGKPMAKIVAYEPSDMGSLRGLFAGEIDVAEDFDQTPDWLVESFEGK